MNANKKSGPERSPRRSSRQEHEHCFQVFVTKGELRYQLCEGMGNNNLLFCLALGRSDPLYAHRLLLASLKYQFLGSLFYLGRAESPERAGTDAAGRFGASPRARRCAQKLPAAEYEYRLFNAFMDSAADAQAWLAEHAPDSVPAAVLLRRYTAVRAHCSRMLASPAETYFADEYRQIIDYIASADTVPAAVFDRSDFPRLPFPLQSEVDYGNLYD